VLNQPAVTAPIVSATKPDNWTTHWQPEFALHRRLAVAAG
jgi:hypothetical protein